MSESKIKGYCPIAVRDDRGGNSTVSYNPDEKKFIFSISGDVIERPLTIQEINLLKDNFEDIISMRGRYLFLKDYDLDGKKVDG